MKKFLIIILALTSFGAMAGTCTFQTHNSMMKTFLKSAGFTVIEKEWSANFNVNLTTFSGAKVHGHCGFMPSRCSQTNTTFGVLGVMKVANGERRTIHSKMISENVHYQKNGNYPFPSANIVQRRLLNDELIQKLKAECRKI